MDFYDFVPAKNFADWDALFEGAGSENRETLLPGELEFSDQVSLDKAQIVSKMIQVTSWKWGRWEDKWERKHDKKYN